MLNAIGKHYYTRAMTGAYLNWWQRILARRYLRSRNARARQSHYFF